MDPKCMDMVRMNISKQRNNLVNVCRLSVKKIIDNSCFEALEENNESILNFLAIMEHILTFRIKVNQTWYGVEEKKSFWEYIKVGCRHVPHSCINSISSLTVPKTSKGKGRAWLRQVLMEKRLSEYLHAAAQNTTATRAFYLEGAILLSDQLNIIIGTLLGLNSIDFSFDIKGSYLDSQCMEAIDFTPYLRFEQCRQSIQSDEQELEELSQSSCDKCQEVCVEEEEVMTESSWQTKYNKLLSKYQHIYQQKGYLEELVRLRDLQIEEVAKQKAAITQTLERQKEESVKERHQLEAVILELQSQLSSIKEVYTSQTQQLDVLMKRLNNQMVTIQFQTDIPMQDLESPTHSDPNSRANADGQSTGSNDIPGLLTSQVAVDNKSVLSLTSHSSLIKDIETQSLIPLAGSLTSLNSGRSETPGNQPANKPLEASAVKECVEPDENTPSQDSTVSETPGNQSTNKPVEASAVKKCVEPDENTHLQDSAVSPPISPSMCDQDKLCETLQSGATVCSEGKGTNETND